MRSGAFKNAPNFQQLPDRGDSIQEWAQKNKVLGEVHKNLNTVLEGEQKKLNLIEQKALLPEKVRQAQVKTKVDEQGALDSSIQTETERKEGARDLVVATAEGARFDADHAEEIFDSKKKETEQITEKRGLEIDTLKEGFEFFKFLDGGETEFKNFADIMILRDPSGFDEEGNALLADFFQKIKGPTHQANALNALVEQGVPQEKAELALAKAKNTDHKFKVRTNVKTEVQRAKDLISGTGFLGLSKDAFKGTESNEEAAEKIVSELTLIMQDISVAAGHHIEEGQKGINQVLDALAKDIQGTQITKIGEERTRSKFDAYTQLLQTLFPDSPIPVLDFEGILRVSTIRFPRPIAEGDFGQGIEDE